MGSPHELKLAVRGNEADGSIRIEFTEPDTLVELAVVEFNSTF